MIVVSDEWKRAYPGAAVGFLAMRNVTNPDRHPALDVLKGDLQAQLRARFTGADRSALETLPTIQAYTAYYKRFKKTYHVLLQLDSVVFKGRSIPSVSAVVEAMFMAELKNQLFTAGHDLDVVAPPVRVDVAKGDEEYTLLSGQPQTLKASDMMMADAQGVISSVVYGPDRRTQITRKTQRVLFAVYAPPGVEAKAVNAHLEDIEEYVKTASPLAERELLEVYSA